MLNWANEGLDYHEKHHLEDCLFCGNSLTTERKQALARNFDEAWTSFNRKVRDANANCTKHLQDFKNIFQGLAKEAEFQPSMQAEAKPLRIKLTQTIEQIETFLNGISELLAKKKENPSERIALSQGVVEFDIGEWEAPTPAIEVSMNERAFRCNSID